MRIVFADTIYWVALLVPGDQWRARAIAVTERLGSIRHNALDLLTLAELLPHLLAE